MVKILPINLIREHPLYHIHWLFFYLKLAVAFHTKELSERIALDPVIKILGILCHFEYNEIVLVDWKQFSKILSFIIEV